MSRNVVTHYLWKYTPLLVGIAGAGVGLWQSLINFSGRSELFSLGNGWQMRLLNGSPGVIICLTGLAIVWFAARKAAGSRIKTRKQWDREEQDEG